MCLGRLTSKTHVVNCFSSMYFKVFCKENQLFPFCVVGTWGIEKWSDWFLLKWWLMLEQVIVLNLLTALCSSFWLSCVFCFFFKSVTLLVMSLQYLHFSFAWYFKSIRTFPIGKVQRTIIPSVSKLQVWTFPRFVLSPCLIVCESLSWSGYVCECM